MAGSKPDLALPLSELEEYGGRLRDIKRRMNHTRKLFESYRDDIGDSGVYDKLEEFESNWEDGREDINQQLDALAQMSDAVVREFKKLDDKLAKDVSEGVRRKEQSGTEQSGTEQSGTEQSGTEQSGTEQGGKD